MPTVTAELASERLGRPVNDWITDQRARKATWSLIVARLHAETGLAVSTVTLRNWLTEREPAA